MKIFSKFLNTKFLLQILSAFLACATAAPSGLIAPIAQIPYSAIAIPAIIPTISPGDIQAASIDAQVKAQDLARAAVDAQLQAEDIARAAADKAKEAAEQATENINEKSVTTVDLANEKNNEAFWSVEDQKWQAIGALQTAEAQIDGAVASNAPVLAKAAVGALPYVAAIAPAPIVAPISPVAYSGLVASSNIATAEAKSIEKSEASAKSAEVKTEEKSEKVEAGEAVVKTSEIAVNDKPVSLTQPWIAPVGITNVYRYDVVAPGLSPIIAQPLVKYAAIPQLHGVVAPTLLKGQIW